MRGLGSNVYYNPVHDFLDAARSAQQIVNTDTAAKRQVQLDARDMRRQDEADARRRVLEGREDTQWQRTDTEYEHGMTQRKLGQLGARYYEATRDHEGNLLPADQLLSRQELLNKIITQTANTAPATHGFFTANPDVDEINPLHGVGLRGDKLHFILNRKDGQLAPLTANRSSDPSDTVLEMSFEELDAEMRGLFTAYGNAAPKVDNWREKEDRRDAREDARADRTDARQAARDAAILARQEKREADERRREIPGAIINMFTKQTIDEETGQKISVVDQDSLLNLADFHDVTGGDNWTISAGKYRAAVRGVNQTGDGAGKRIADTLERIIKEHGKAAAAIARASMEEEPRALLDEYLAAQEAPAPAEEQTPKQTPKQTPERKAALKTKEAPEPQASAVSTAAAYLANRFLR
jgi:hypothetical protein